MVGQPIWFELSVEMMLFVKNDEAQFLEFLTNLCQICHSKTKQALWNETSSQYIKFQPSKNKQTNCCSNWEIQFLEMTFLSSQFVTEVVIKCIPRSFKKCELMTQHHVYYEWNDEVPFPFVRRNSLCWNCIRKRMYFTFIFFC